MSKENSCEVTVDKIRIKECKINIKLEGIRAVMFDRYPGDNTTQLEWCQKIYLDQDGETICLPSLNLMSFLTAHNTNSAPKRIMDKRKFKDIANGCLSSITINPEMIPFTRNGDPIKFGTIKPNTAIDEKSGLYLHRSVARLDKGIPNPKSRPVLPLPWELKFEMLVLQNKEVTLQQIERLLVEGGLCIGIGTFRGVFGKFNVTEFKIDQ